MKISKYNSEKVMQYSPEDGTAEFISPVAYISKPASKMYHIKTKYGVDQVVSKDHRVLVYTYDRGYQFDKYKVVCAEDIVTKHRLLKNGYRHRINTVFTPKLNTSVNFSNDEIRVIVMACADGSFQRKTNTCLMRLKKLRKVSRARALLKNASIQYKESEKNGVYSFSFKSPLRTKSLGCFWEASSEQLSVIIDECLNWDGTRKGSNTFFTCSKESADFIQYAGSACGLRSVLSEDRRGDNIDYRVFFNTNTKVGINGTPNKADIKEVPVVGDRQYCFTVPSGFFVARRNGRVFITGNCGMVAAKTSLKASDLPDSLAALRASIETAVPHGRTDNGRKNDKGAWRGNFPESVRNSWHQLMDKRYDRMTEKYPHLLDVNDINHLGTLGTGNHFIEVCLDESDNVWVMLHSGSRGVGNAIGRTFIELAQQDMQKFFINLPDKDLAYLPEGTEHFEDYVEAVHWAQDFAKTNRDIMMQNTVASMQISGLLPSFSIVDEVVNCHHNYVAREHHYGKDILVTRKGAVRARKGDLGIIPGSMGAKSFIVEGKGNNESFHSCSHGAGRMMSRAEAKRTFTVKDHEEATKGVECRKDESVIDETPKAYKDIEDVMKAQADLVDIKHTLKQVLCVKG